MNAINFAEIRDALLVGFLLSIMLGPVFFMLIQTSITRGFRAAISFDLGVMLSDASLILLTYVGSKDWLEHLKNDVTIFFVGGLALILYGIFYAQKDTGQQADTPAKTNSKWSYVGLLFKGFLLNIINIGVLIFWIGTVAVIGPRLDMNPYKIIKFFCVVFGFYFCMDIIKILLAKKLRKKMTPKNIIRTRQYTGLGLIIFGVILSVKGLLAWVL